MWLNHHHKRAASAVIILEHEGSALVVKTHYKTHWTFPGGFIDADETPKQAAAREVLEEVGLVVDELSISLGWTAARHSTAADTYQFVFKAPLPRGGIDNIILQANEIDDWKLVSKADILSDCLNYSKAAELWARDNVEIYVEQTFGNES